MTEIAELTIKTIKKEIFKNDGDFINLLHQLDSTIDISTDKCTSSILFNELFCLFDHSYINNENIKPPDKNLIAMLESSVFCEKFDSKKLGRLLISYCESSNDKMVEYLLFKRKKNKVTINDFLNQVNYNGLNCLSLGIRNNNINIVILLTTDKRLTKSINVNYDKSRPFYECCLYKRNDILKHLIFNCNIAITKTVEDILRDNSTDSIELANRFFKIREAHDNLNLSLGQDENNNGKGSGSTKI